MPDNGLRVTRRMTRVTRKGLGPVSGREQPKVLAAVADSV